MRMAGRFSRRIRGYAKAHGIPVIDCPAGQRKHELAEHYLAKTTVTHGLFLVLVGRAQAPVWDVSTKHHLERKKRHALCQSPFLPCPRPRLGLSDDQDQWAPAVPGKISSGHEYVACQTHKTGIGFTKQADCFTSLSDPAGFAKIADTLSDPRAVGRLNRVCDR